MKQRTLYYLSLSIVCLIAFTYQANAQNDTEWTAEEQEVVDFNLKWGKEVMINRDLDKIDDFYPADQQFYHVRNKKLVKGSIEENKNSIQRYMAMGKYISYKNAGEPMVWVGPSGKTAVIVNELEFEFKHNSFPDTIFQFKTFEMAYLEKEESGWKYRVGWEEMIYNPEIKKLSDDVLDRYAGKYKYPEQEFAFTVLKKDGGLQITNMQGDFKMEAVTEFTFHVPDWDAHVVFGMDSSGAFNVFDILAPDGSSRAYRVEE
jgi:hypothetical protein